MCACAVSGLSSSGIAARTSVRAEQASRAASARDGARALAIPRMTSADAIAFTAASLAHRPGAAHVADQQPLVLLHDGLRAPPRPAVRRPESLLHAESAPDRANLVDGSAP